MSRPAARRARSGAIDTYLAFRASLREALRAGTPAALRRVLANAGDPHLRTLARCTDQVLEPVIARMTLAEPLLADLHPAARLALLDAEPRSARPRPIGPGNRRLDRAWLPAAGRS